VSCRRRSRAAAASSGKNVVLMPSYVNIGAYVDEGTMVDTWATVGSCAQIGKNVHLSGGVGIGGVLEPLQANPTIIEDNCFIGARSEVVEGVIVGENSVISMGVYIGQSHQDLRPRNRRGHPTAGFPRARSSSPATLPSKDGKLQPVLRGDRQEGRRARPAPRPASTICCAATDLPPHHDAPDRSDEAPDDGWTRLFQLMADKQASDIFISAGTPIHIKIQGNTVPVNQQVMLDPGR
jgi:hypothetical protein